MVCSVSVSYTHLDVYKRQQLVEHNLAKVRVASSSLVFRSTFWLQLPNAQVAELVDAHVSGCLLYTSSSVKFCHKVGLNYVSCSPFRVPIAGLAAAQAAIEG